MIIQKIKIDGKEFVFNRNSNLITSKNNSAGKTTLIRSLLYGIGYPIPSTRGFDLKGRTIDVTIYNPKKLEITRNDTIINIAIDNDGGIINKVFDSYDNELEVLSILYGVNNPKILKSAPMSIVCTIFMY